MAKVLIISPNVIGSSMAGPGIRSWEFAKALSKQHDIVLISPNSSDLKPEGFTLIPRSELNRSKAIQGAQVMIVQNLTLPLALFAKRRGLRVIVDAYDPVPLELLEVFRDEPLKIREDKIQSSIKSLEFNFKMGDAFLCASEKQRDLWLGFLLAHKGITSLRYDADTSLRNLIDVVPFGLPEMPPKKTGPGFREKYNFSPSDHIVLWGGGIWNWFDPLSLIKAIHLLGQSRSDIKLVFMGIINPDPAIAQMAMCRQAIELAKELGVMNKSVYFNEGWVPYDERQNYLLEASIGVSTHFDHLETRFSFRTRMLDYIWAKLPILATTGDSFAELIQQHDLGLVVPYCDEQAIAKAICTLLDNTAMRKRIQANLTEFQGHYYWSSLVKPIDKMIRQFEEMPPKRLRIKDLSAMASFTFKKALLYANLF